MLDSGEFDLSSEQLGKLQREDGSLALIRELVSRQDSCSSRKGWVDISEMGGMGVVSSL